MYAIGTKVKIEGMNVIGIVTGYDLTGKYAHVSYVFMDDEERVINYGCFDVMERVRVW